VISPGKTWEGAAGGLIWAVGISIALAAVLDLSFPLWQQVLLGLLLGTVAQMGDLLESALKRRAGVKDAGVLIPGHGGVLDRIDSLLVTIPVTYYILALIID
ncbi:MAG: CDP-archaeol synthase, partial [Chloroflexi bacterium]|nr:CDP-archaeol synthase [Chloroflexota bacterium]